MKEIVRDWNVKWKNARKIEGKVRKQRGKVGKKKRSRRKGDIERYMELISI